MRLSSFLIVLSAFASAAVLSLVAAGQFLRLIEEGSEIGVREALDAEGLVWAEVEADGLTVTLAGEAPTEALRFAAVSTAGSVVDAARIIDEMHVTAVSGIAPPRFSIEILRNDAGLSVFGLIPAESDRDDLVARLAAAAPGKPVSDLIQTADYSTPDGWKDALDFAISAVKLLPRSKVSMDADRVIVTAISDSSSRKTALEKQLNAAAPRDLKLTLEIAAPRPVITPFTLRFVIDEGGPRFDACAADTDAARDAILRAAQAAGVAGTASCTVAMGVPTPRWSDAVTLAIDGLKRLGAGSVTFADADITLIAAMGTDPALFDRVVGELENALPDVFALHARLLEPEKVDNQGPPEFVATLSPEGLVQLRGRLNDDALRELADSYARAAFGSGNVYVAARVDDGLPMTWPSRVLAALEGLAQLDSGVVTVTPDRIMLKGNTGDQDAQQGISQLFAAKLGEAEVFDIDITYLEKLDPVAVLPTPEECEAEVQAIQETAKIGFEPGSATIAAESLGIMDDIAEILRQCEGIRLEIQGHTDSQGREEMNLSLSQARAQSVLNELRARRVLTSTFVATGYGETQPIADNGTEEGREENRRIEFKLIQPKPSVAQPESTLDAMAQSDGSVSEPAEIQTENEEDAAGAGD